MADVGAHTTAEVVGKLEGEVEAGEVEGPGEPMRERLVELLAEPRRDRRARRDRRLASDPRSLMVVGVNGTGKTTTIGKLAWHLQKELGLSVMLAAADTYRAAAVEQLETWAERAGREIVKARPGRTPPRSSSTRSPPPRRAASTSCSSTPPAASTPTAT